MRKIKREEIYSVHETLNFLAHFIQNMGITELSWKGDSNGGEITFSIDPKAKVNPQPLEDFCAQIQGMYFDQF